MKARGNERVVYMEDSEFEKRFVVYASDPVEARYILSPSMMSRILSLRSKGTEKISLAFAGSKVFMALPHSRNFFEPELSRTAFDMGQVLEIAREVQLCMSIVKDLNLNTRIWTKL